MDTVGQIQPFGSFAPLRTLVTNGAPLAISQYRTLYNLIGTTFGGDGQVTFNLPSIAPLSSPLSPVPQVMSLEGDWPQSGMVGLIGEVRLWPKPQLIPPGWQACDGSLLQISSYEAAYNVLGTAFGGNGQSTFGVPGLDSPGPGLIYIVALGGVYPVRGGPDEQPLVDYVLGSLTMFSGNYAPAGFRSLTQSNVLPVVSYQALFTLLGTTYGGDGSSTFALPQIAPLAGVQYIMPQSGLYPERP